MTTSPEVQAFATGFPVTLLHVAVSVAMLLVAATVYILLTPHHEIRLVREGNVAAAVDVGGALVGLAIPLAYSLKASANLMDLALWGAATVAVQLLVFRLVDLVLHGLPGRIQQGEMAAAAVLVGAKLATALIVAASVAA
ncbi:MAG: putative rane protein [Phenylobacterium sp.]|nr:putative rane protein [Phenylobacterium sp.]